MRRPKVYVTRRLPFPAFEELKKHCDVDLYDSDSPPDRQTLMEHVKDKDAVLCLLTDKINSEVFDIAPDLKVVSTYSVGYDHIDVEEATRRGIYVCNTPGVLTDAVADHAWALLLATARRVVESDNVIRGGEGKISWYPTFLLGSAVWGRTIGIIGLGRIGSAIARRAKGFNMKILYYSRSRKPELEAELGVKYVELEELLRTADFVVLSVTLNPSTYHLINEKRLKLMKSTAYLINISRGAVVDTDALVKALKEGWIAGAGLDVFEQEPLPADHPLTKLKNVVLTPHTGSATIEARSKMAELAVNGILKVLRGEEPENLVNPEVMKVKPLSKVKMLD